VKSEAPQGTAATSPPQPLVAEATHAAGTNESPEDRPARAGALPVRDPREVAGWRKVRVGLVLLILWYVGSIPYLALRGLGAVFKTEVWDFEALPLQILRSVPIVGYILCVFVPQAGKARNLALANLGVLALGLGLTLLARQLEMQAHPETTPRTPAPATTRPGIDASGDPVDQQAADQRRKRREQLGAWLLLLQFMLWWAQVSCSTFFLHATAQALGALDLAKNAARAGTMAVACTLLLLLFALVGALAPTLLNALSLVILIVGVAAVACFIWQMVLLVEAQGVLGYYLSARRG
jgi:hypothetical protein